MVTSRHVPRISKQLLRLLSWRASVKRESLLALTLLGGAMFQSAIRELKDMRLVRAAVATRNRQPNCRPPKSVRKTRTILQGIARISVSRKPDSATRRVGRSDHLLPGEHVQGIDALGVSDCPSRSIWTTRLPA